MLDAANPPALGSRQIERADGEVSRASALLRAFAIAPPSPIGFRGPHRETESAHLVNWLQDIFPEVAEALEVGGGLGQIASAVLRLRAPA